MEKVKRLTLRRENMEESYVAGEASKLEQYRYFVCVFLLQRSMHGNGNM